MKKLFWFATGIAAGLAVAKQMRENPEAKAAVEDAAKRARAIGEAFTTGYKERELEIKRNETAARKSKPAAKKPATAKASKPVAVKKPAVKKTAAKPSAK
jgi:hypothetical protein